MTELADLSEQVRADWARPPYKPTDNTFDFVMIVM